MALTPFPKWQISHTKSMQSCQARKRTAKSPTRRSRPTRNGSKNSRPRKTLERNSKLRFSGELVWSNRHSQSTVLYNKMLYPFVPFAFRGAIWYQDAQTSAMACSIAINAGALQWLESSLPKPRLKFYFVQLAPFNYGGDPERLPRLMEAQQAPQMPRPAVGMAVINDAATWETSIPTTNRRKETCRPGAEADYGKDINRLPTSPL